MLHNQISPYFLSQFIGFDALLNHLAESSHKKVATSYPPFNIEQEGNRYVISLAVAGFSKQDISISMKGRELSIKGVKSAKSPDSTLTTIHRGIAGRDFESKFTLSEFIKIKGAVLENGILEIYLENEVPEKEVTSINILDSKPEVPFLGKPQTGS